MSEARATGAEVDEMDRRREFVFLRQGLLWSLVTFFLWVPITIYFLWRIGQILTGAFPLWLVPVPVLGIAIMWIPWLKAVETIVVERDGNVVFDRALGRREVNAIYIERIHPWLDLPLGGFVVRHADGWELLPGDRGLIAELAHELLRLNPEIEVRGVPVPNR
ncbi:MAG: hypothetical protein GY719_03500 [bacterium]|nr:hypothetical protein [bacterium]